MTDEPSFDVATANRYFATTCFNGAWAWMERKERSAEDDRAMIASAQASIHHWRQRPDVTAMHLSVGYWQASRAHALARQPAEAKRMAEVALGYASEYALAPFYLGYAHEAMARAALLVGDHAEARRHLREAEACLASVQDREDRTLLERDVNELRAGAQAAGPDAGGQLVWHATMSVDGFIAGVGDAMDWAFGHEDGPNAIAAEVIRTTGALLIGRRSYDVGRRGTRAETRMPYGGSWSGPQFVISHRPIDGDPGVTRLTGGVRDAVRTALAAARGKNVVLIGADVARQAVDAGMVDHLILHVAPVLLGAGVRLFDVSGVAPIRLDPVEIGRSGAVANLRYRFTGPGS